MSIIFISAVVVLLILGFTDAFRRIVFWIFQPQEEKNLILLVHPTEADECEFLIRSAAERIRWMSLSEPCKLICINEKEEKEIDEICANLSLQFPFLTVSNLENLRYNIK